VYANIGETPMPRLETRIATEQTEVCSTMFMIQNISRNKLLLATFLFMLVSTASTHSQTRRSAPLFQGEWNWAEYADSRSELPPAYRNSKLKDVPRASLYLKIRQRGNRLTGEYSASRRFLAKLEEGEFEAQLENGIAKLELQSGFNGKITATIQLRGGLLHWKIIKSEGTFYFPDDVKLRRLIRKNER
jgi:hypothetical protein